MSKAPGFLLGPIEVTPPLRTISAGGRTRTVEPRVMQVLVALAEAKGAVLSRDDLIDLCWDGRIVGDNAINRVISQLRQALSHVAGDAVRLETITKVGFRLVAADTDAEPLAPASDPVAVKPAAPAAPARWKASRRNVLIGAGMLGIGTIAGSAALVRFAGGRPDPQAVALAERGWTVMKSARIGATEEAMALFRQSVERDPGYADGWGALASSYRHLLDGYDEGEKSSYPQMVASAANRALAIDPEQPDALIAKAAIYPEYRNWSKQEPVLQDLVARFPMHWYANARLGILLQETGRFADALRYTGRVVELDRQLAPAWAGLVRTLTMAGRFHEADAAYERARTFIAPHPLLWLTRLFSLFESKRFAEAAAFARDPRTLPEEFGPNMPATYGDMAEALANQDPAGLARSREYVLATMIGPTMTPRAAPILTTLGEHDLAMEAYEAYLLGGQFRGNSWPSPGPLDLRNTAYLFTPGMAMVRAHPRFGKLLERSGLESYWKESGSQPDFRRD